MGGVSTVGPPQDPFAALGAQYEDAVPQPLRAPASPQKAQDPFAALGAVYEPAAPAATPIPAPVASHAPALQKYAKPGPYTTKLAPDQESAFQQWVKQNQVPWQDSPAADYDMRGYYKAMVAGDPDAHRAANLHFPDTWKTPYHKTFSNESIYATSGAPHWDGDVLKDASGQVIADERPKTDAARLNATNAQVQQKLDQHSATGTTMDPSLA